MQKRKYDTLGTEVKRENEYICSSFGGCGYPAPDRPHDILFGSIEDLGGWFLANDNSNQKMIELFGLDPKEVLSGETSLVILTNSQGIIVALHPQKTLSDIYTILSQQPELADLKDYPEFY
mgnify:CR=1 FL=1